MLLPSSGFCFGGSCFLYLRVHQRQRQQVYKCCYLFTKLHGVTSRRLKSYYSMPWEHQMSVLRVTDSDSYENVPGLRSQSRNWTKWLRLSVVFLRPSSQNQRLHMKIGLWPLTAVLPTHIHIPTSSLKISHPLLEFCHWHSIHEKLLWWCKNSTSRFWWICMSSGPLNMKKWFLEFCLYVYVPCWHLNSWIVFKNLFITGWYLVNMNILVPKPGIPQIDLQNKMQISRKQL
jgi:hypothetical protein